MIDLVSVQATNHWSWIVDRYSNDHPLVMTGVLSLPDHRIQSDTAACQRWTLRESLKYAHA